MSLDHLFDQYGTESAELPAVETTTSVDVMADLVSPAGASLPGDVAHAEKSAAIASQLTELADRADDLVEEDKAYLDKVVCTESLHREYGYVMRAYGLPALAESFESAASDRDRLTGLAADARRMAARAQGCRDSVLDFSAEGKFMQWLRNDRSKLDAAHAALDNAERAIKKVDADLKDHPVTVNHKGMSTFLSQGGVPIDNLSHALGEEAAWLSEAHDYVETSKAELLAVLNKLGHGDAQAALRAVEGKSLPNSHKLSRGNVKLMGSVMITGTVEGEGGFIVPKFTRRPGASGKGGSQVLSAIGHGLSVGAKAAATAFIFGGVATGIGFSLAAGSIPLGFTALFLSASGQAALTRHAVIGGAAGVINGVIAGAAAASRDDKAEKIKSVAGVGEIHKAITLIQGYSRYTNFDFDDDAIDKAIAAAKANIGGLPADEKKHAKALIAEIETAFGRLMVLVDCVYEQALYTTTMAAHLLERVAKAARKLN